MYKTSNYFIQLLIIVFVLFLFSSCSLIKIESEQTPLSKTELNTRLLTQAFVKNATETVEINADSILSLSNDINVQINALKWKINIMESLRKVGFQTSPKLALLDCWTMMVSLDSFFNKASTKQLFIPYEEIPISTINKNLIEIEKIARVVLPEKEYNNHKLFVYDYAKSNAVNDLNFNHKTVRESYNIYKKIPDSIAIETVGSLSEVVYDLTNRLSYTTENTSKNLQWNSELFLKENGIDSMKIKGIADSLNLKFNELVRLAEDSPELIDKTLKELENQLYRFNYRLDKTLSSSIEELSEERKEIIKFLADESQEIDALIFREREALLLKADDLSIKLLDRTMIHINDLIKTSLIYIIILLTIIILLPFSIGYFIGKKINKNS